MEIQEREKTIEERKKKVINSLKKGWWVWIILAIIVILAIYIRTQNLYGLKDITTGEWTLGPDLDPFLFLRWAKYIVEHGSLFKVDMMRNVPLGHSTTGEMKLLAYLIAWFHKGASMFGSESVEHSAVLFPVFFFALTAAIFFLFVRKFFYFMDRNKANAIALIATAFFIVIPTLLSRTIAGIPEKESCGFFFMFLSFYLFLSAWQEKKLKKAGVFAILAGLSTAVMALIWGGVVFIFMTIGFSVLIAFLFGKTERRHILVYILWIMAFYVLASPFSSRYSLRNLLVSSSSIIMFATLLVLVMDFVLFSKKFKEHTEKFKDRFNIPREIFSIIVSGILAILVASIIFSPSFLINQSKDVIDHLVHPFGTDRLSLTVAENRQPYFTDEWRGSLGPQIRGIPLFFWLFFTGSIFLFYMAVKKVGKEKIVLTLAYAIFLFSLIFSRYSPDNILNGTSRLSTLVYFGGMLIFALSFAYVYFKYYKEGRISLFKKINFSYILLFMFFILTIVAARGGARLVMMMAPPTSIIVAYFCVNLVEKARKSQDDAGKIVIWIIAGIIVLLSAYTFYNYYQTSLSNARGFVPSVYTQQWQKAMAWVRGNTAEDAVFSHWWDYGYWLQSMGNRATVLDGGNVLSYWNHMFARYVLTGTNTKEAFEFLYAHNVTHLLIDSTDIGKYSAYSSIGSDENYDRFSWIPTFKMNEQATQEAKDSTLYFYQGGMGLDEDLLWKDEKGIETFLPAGRAAIGALIFEQTNDGEIRQPEIIIIDQNQQYRIPIKYVYFEDKLYSFESGYEAGIFIFSSIVEQGGGIGVNDKGAAMYLSPRTVNSQMVRLYLFNQGDLGGLVHVEEHPIIENLRNQGIKIGSFVLYGDIFGPIKIWKIKYPANVQFDEKYLETAYPNEEIRLAKQ